MSRDLEMALREADGFSGRASRAGQCRDATALQATGSAERHSAMCKCTLKKFEIAPAIHPGQKHF
jgi:hypothetical protein